MVEKDAMAETSKPGEADPYWWTPWAVLIGILLFGLLGFFGKLGSAPSGPTAADVPTTIASAAP